MKARPTAGRSINWILDRGKGPVDYFFFGDQQWQSGFRTNSDNSRYNIGGNAGFPLSRRENPIMASYHQMPGYPVFMQ